MISGRLLGAVGTFPQALYMPQNVRRVLDNFNDQRTTAQHKVDKRSRPSRPTSNDGPTSPRQFDFYPHPLYTGFKFGNHDA